MVGPGAEREADRIGAMSALLSHRGPDDSGLWTSAGVVLGHRRLSILDLTAAGHQPMQSADGRFCITYNGEIYNYLELKEELQSRGHRFRTRTDTEVLLAAYAEWGPACLGRFNGMWAFALWDSKERKLFLSRDRFGKKPLYTTFDGKGRLYFASEMKALFLVPGMNRTLNEQAVADFCAQRVVSHLEETFVREIHQLAPATSMIWSEGKVEQKSYWSLATLAQVEESKPNLEELADALRDAVRIRLRADTPIGCLVSGGLDSSTIASLMRALCPAERPVHLFTTVTDPPTEEAEGIESLLKKGGFQAHFHTPTARLFWEDLPRLLWHQEQPFADGSMAAHYALMREARLAGVPVLLTGQGGDEIFAGYPTYLWVYLGSQIRRGRWLHAARWAWQAAHAQRLHLSRILFYSLPRSVRSVARRGVMRHNSAWIGPEILSAVRSREEQMSAPSGDELESYLRNSITQWTLPGFLHYEDRNSMAFGVETRLPFLDYRLAEKMFRVHSDEKLLGGTTKSILRQIAKPMVPAEIIQRTAKQGYPAPLSAWLRALKGQIRDVAHSTSAKRCPLVQTSEWGRLVERFFSGSGEEGLDSVWRGLVCILWYERVFTADLQHSNNP